VTKDTGIDGMGDSATAALLVSAIVVLVKLNCVEGSFDIFVSDSC